jgi:hypothetical protein
MRSRDCGYEPIINATQRRPEEVVSQIEEIIKKDNPEYMITDGLNKHCFNAIELAKKNKKDIIAVILTGDVIDSREKKCVYNEAKEKGYLVFKKPYDEGIFKFFNYKSQLSEYFKD